MIYISDSKKIEWPCSLINLFKIIYLLLIIHAENMQTKSSRKLQGGQSSFSAGYGAPRGRGRQSCSRVLSRAVCMITSCRWMLLADRKPITAEGAGGKKSPSQNPTAEAASRQSSDGRSVRDSVCAILCVHVGFFMAVLVYVLNAHARLLSTCS